MAPKKSNTGPEPERLKVTGGWEPAWLCDELAPSPPHRHLHCLDLGGGGVAPEVAHDPALAAGGVAGGAHRLLVIEPLGDGVECRPCRGLSLVVGPLPIEVLRPERQPLAGLLG